MRHLHFILIAAVSLGVCSAEAEVVISAKPTLNMACSGGMCAATAKKAVLNAADLDAMLEAGDVRVESGVVANDIEIDASVDWVSASRLTLDAWRAIAFDKHVTVAGPGALTIMTDDGGSGGDFRFSRRGHVAFLGATGSLVINGNDYVLVHSIKELKFVANASVPFVALVRSIDARRRLYFDSPVEFFRGTLEGLGNTISNLVISDDRDNDTVGLIGELTPTGLLPGRIRDIGLLSADITGTGLQQTVGVLVGENEGGSFFNSYATGRVTALRAGSVGGLVGANDGVIQQSHADVAVAGGGEVGGLAGSTEDCFGPCRGAIDGCYATGTVSGSDGASAGGLFGYDAGQSISNSYAMGAVGGGAFAGGLVGTIADGAGFVPALTASYSIGSVSGGAGAVLGGLIGQDLTTHDITAAYWDLETSGVDDPSRGAGNFADDPGILGLTTSEFQSGLPASFSASIWAEKADVNGGYPYLFLDPPP